MMLAEIGLRSLLGGHDLATRLVNVLVWLLACWRHSLEPLLYPSGQGLTEADESVSPRLVADAMDEEDADGRLASVSRLRGVVVNRR
jgi:hypothetical protein